MITHFGNTPALHFIHHQVAVPPPSLQAEFDAALRELGQLRGQLAGFLALEKTLLAQENSFTTRETPVGALPHLVAHVPDFFSVHHASWGG